MICMIAAVVANGCRMVGTNGQATGSIIFESSTIVTSGQITHDACNSGCDNDYHGLKYTSNIF